MRRIKEKRNYPTAGMSTAEYIKAYFKLNNHFRYCTYIIGGKVEVIA